MNPITWLLALLQRLWRFLFASKRDENLYSLDHAILHIQVPPPSLWMNMGYWKTETTLSGASQALLTQVLIAARLLSPDGHPVAHPPRRRLHLLDVGIGCGDQTLSLIQSQRLVDVDVEDAAGTVAAAPQHQHQHQHQPLFDSYTGLTIAPTQAATARARVAALPSRSSHSHSHSHSRTPACKTQIFCADAADPSSWPVEIHASLRSRTKGQDENENETENEDEDEENENENETWLLALDTLYHFRPSRRALLQHAARELRASLMAFDLLLSETASWWQRLVLRAICWVTGTPYANFVTRAEYEALLVGGGGYALADVEVRDVSGEVFAGLAGFLARRERELRPFGIGVGKFRGARVVFDWWARSGVVRGVVVVARR
ncbi:uncharacterized protein ACLA_045790 [Aspergillus clavatus NRRL 1]|uniref:S-adenosyl-L-methionine-dependent methyltransferase n=1 Tax=Aspergillus clavatus (strain ATCC 1007 / CBS 513.65 / DSM 816 / NCTC 3887 / NRRL 1 / QM 1276 / 107) TaxID=344612 RepID=A1CGV9_ASPCL|nr:uncharacterized protein ACLA_045790 [Aspergillus clavatus NRRL 1]EAW10114.1 conserved hypothetical protein [Aspergillus clavatus NRRL 1]